ncbi:MAG: hypothetical protein Q9181_002150, partial [Wetmoreana brouardii]
QSFILVSASAAIYDPSCRHSLLSIPPGEPTRSPVNCIMSSKNNFQRLMSRKDKAGTLAAKKPKQTSGFLDDNFPKDGGNSSEKDDSKKGNMISQIRQLLANTGINKYKESDVMYALESPYADGDPNKAFGLLKLLRESEAGIISPYDPRVKMLGAVNREGTTCYLDALLFAMFTRSKCFEAMLYASPADEKKNRLATLLRLWVTTLRVGKLITPDLTKHIQLALADCGWEDAAEIHQQDASEAFSFITETLELPLLTLKMDIYHHGKEEVGDDHKFVNERMLEVAIPDQPSDGSVVTLDECLETYFNNRVEVKRYLQQRHPTGSIKSKPSFDSEKGHTTHIETVECADSLPATPLSPLPASIKSPKRPIGSRTRAPSIIQESYISEKNDDLGVPAYESPQNGRRRAGSVRKEVMMPAWQFFSLIRICLKRYTFEPNGEAKRKNTYVDIPLEFALPHFIQDDNMAEDAPPFGNFKVLLQSVVCHQGTRVDSGHYIGLVRASDPGQPDQDRWLRHDDLAPERVAEVDNIQQFLREETPYLLFYQVVPLDGDPGNIADGEASSDADQPPAYSEIDRWNAEYYVDFDRKFGIDTSTEANSDSPPRTSSSSDRKESNAFTDRSSNTTCAETAPRMSIEGDGSRRSSKGNVLAVPNGTPAPPEGNRLSASMSRFAGRLTRDKAENSTSVPAATSGGPSLEVRPEPGATDKAKLKKEKSKSKLKDHQHLIRGKTKSEKPDRECIIM